MTLDHVSCANDRPECNASMENATRLDLTLPHTIALGTIRHSSSETSWLYCWSLQNSTTSYSKRHKPTDIGDFERAHATQVRRTEIVVVNEYTNTCDWIGYEQIHSEIIHTHNAPFNSLPRLVAIGADLIKHMYKILMSMCTTAKYARTTVGWNYGRQTCFQTSHDYTLLPAKDLSKVPVSEWRSSMEVAWLIAWQHKYFGWLTTYLVLSVK